VVGRAWLAVNIVTTLQPEQLKNHDSTPGKARDFPPFQSVQISSGSEPLSYSVGNGGSSPGGKAARARRRPLPSSIPHSPRSLHDVSRDVNLLTL